MANLLHLENFRRLIGYQPYHFWQQSNAKMFFANCNSIVKEYAWLGGESAGRDDLRRVIGRAESVLADNLNYFPAPKDITEEIYLGCLYHTPIPRLLQLKYGYVNKVGTASWLIRDQGDISNRSVTYIDNNFDTVNDTGQVNFVLGDFTYSDLSQLALACQPDNLPLAYQYDYHPENWLLPARPPALINSGSNTYGFFFPSWAAMRPKIYEGLQAFNGYDPGISGADPKSAYDPDNASVLQSYVNIVERVYTDLNQVTLITNNAGAESSYTIPCSIDDKVNGLLALNLSYCQGYNWPCTCNSGNQTRRIVVNYNSGQELENWQLIIGRLAIAELNRSLSACEQANRELTVWQKDVTRAGGITEETFRVSQDDLNCPLGKQLGAIYAWNEIKNKRLLRAFNT